MTKINHQFCTNSPSCTMHIWNGTLWIYMVSGFDSFEFLEMLASTALWFLLTCLLKFRFALNNWSHSGQFTLAWLCWCFLCWWWLRKDLGFSWPEPTKHPLAWSCWCLWRSLVNLYFVNDDMYICNLDRFPDFLRFKCMWLFMHRVGLNHCPHLLQQCFYF